MVEGARKFGHEHGEAFMVMTYETEDQQVTERIWNSRDGVTPFAVTSKDGQSMTHVRWGEDIYVGPDYMPPLGSRMFVDLTPDRARSHAERNAATYWETYAPSREQFTQEELAEVLANEYLKDPHSPDLIVVAG